MPRPRVDGERDASRSLVEGEPVPPLTVLGMKPVFVTRPVRSSEIEAKKTFFGYSCDPS